MFQAAVPKSKISSAYAYIIGLSWLRAVGTLLILYFASIGLLLCLAWRLPATDSLATPTPEGVEPDELLLKVPTNFSELRAVGTTLAMYNRACPGQVALLLLTFYLFLQVFMMPGSSFMNVLAGSLYGTAAAVPLVAFLSTAGSSGSYWLSRLVVKDVVVGLFPGRIASFSRAVAAQKSQLLAYLIAARLTPVVPSWFINLASPILQVPFKQFLVSTLIGLQPTNIILVHAGSSISHLHSWRDLYGPRTILLLLLCLFGALLPIVVRRRCLPTRGSAGQLPVRLSAASEQLQQLQPLEEDGVAVAYLGAESPRTGAKLTVRQQSGLAVGRQYILNGKVSGDVSDDVP